MELISHFYADYYLPESGVPRHIVEWDLSLGFISTPRDLISRNRLEALAVASGILMSKYYSILDETLVDFYKIVEIRYAVKDVVDLDATWQDSSSQLRGAIVLSKLRDNLFFKDLTDKTFKTSNTFNHFFDPALPLRNAKILIEW